MAFQSVSEVAHAVGMDGNSVHPVIENSLLCILIRLGAVPICASHLANVHQIPVFGVVEAVGDGNENLLAGRKVLVFSFHSFGQ